MAVQPLVAFRFDAEGNVSVDIGPGTHGAACAEIIHAFGEALGTIERDVWRPEVNCQGDCGGCNTAYDKRMAELRAK